MLQFFVCGFGELHFKFFLHVFREYNPIVVRVNVYSIWDLRMLQRLITALRFNCLVINWCCLNPFPDFELAINVKRLEVVSTYNTPQKVTLKVMSPILEEFKCLFTESNFTISVVCNYDIHVTSKINFSIGFKTV